MFNWLTADGYFAGPDGSLTGVVPDEAQAKEAAESLSGFDTILFGRRTYELFKEFWPHAVDDDSPTAPDPHQHGKRTREHRVIGTRLNEMTKLVFSRTLKDAAWENSRILPKLDPREIETMKDRPGKDIIIFGSGMIVSELTQHGLIDEYQFVVCPILLGSGRPLLSVVSKSQKLHLLEAKMFPSGDIMLRYAKT